MRRLAIPGEAECRTYGARGFLACFPSPYGLG